MFRIRPALLAIALLGLSACASTDGPTGADALLEGATESTRTEANGDRITEYRIDGRLRAVQVVPSRGPAYFLYDRDGDGSVDSDRDDVPQTYFRLFGW